MIFAGGTLLPDSELDAAFYVLEANLPRILGGPPLEAETVLDALDKEIAPLGIASWKRPKGGYFVSLNTADGLAKRTLALCKEAGVVMTGAGATYPYGKDPRDRNIRIAPSLPPVAELETAIDVFCVCLRLAALEKLMGK